MSRVSTSLLPSVPSAPPRPLLLRYGVVFGSVCVTAVVAALLRPSAETTPFLFFYAAVLASVWVGGFWPGITATVLSSLAAHFILLAPHGGGWRDPLNLIRTAFFCSTFVIVCYLAERRRVNAEADLRHSEADLKRAQSLAHTGNWRLDVRHNKLVWSAETYRIFGIPEGAPLTYETFLAAIHPDDRAFVDREWQAALGRAPYDLEHRILIGDEVRWVREKAELEFDAQGALLGGFGAVQDITDRKRAEEALIRSEKLATVGRLAATIAHEINNPLEAIMNTLYLVRTDPTLSPSTREMIVLAEVEMNRAAQIARQTLGFTRQSTERAAFRPAEIAESVLGLFERRLNERGVVLRKDYHDPAVEVLGIAGEIRQVLWNLLTNALDAVPDQGKITLRVSRTRDWRTGTVGAARITVADNGRGISREVMARIFEPFFTTKATGTGLGLWVTREIIAKHDGSIRVRSAVNGSQRGTTISFCVPTATQQEHGRACAAVT